jgi:hypothetical protein
MEEEAIRQAELKKQQEELARRDVRHFTSFPVLADFLHACHRRKPKLSFVVSY